MYITTVMFPINWKYKISMIIKQNKHSICVKTVSSIFATSHPPILFLNKNAFQSKAYRPLCKEYLKHIQRKQRHICTKIILLNNFDLDLFALNFEPLTFLHWTLTFLHLTLNLIGSANIILILTLTFLHLILTLTFLHLTLTFLHLTLNLIGSANIILILTLTVLHLILTLTFFALDFDLFALDFLTFE